MYNHIVHSLPIFLAMLFLVYGSALADPSPQEQQLLKLQTVYREFTSLSFTFSQVTRTELRSRSGRGNAIFIRSENPEQPGIMRWNYTEPDPQIILNDGQKLSIYTPKDKQLIVTSAKELNGDITYAFFSGKRNLSDDFSAQTADSRYDFRLPTIELKTLLLTPRSPHPQIKTVQIWYDSTFLLHHLILEDHFGSITELTFSHILTNELDNDRQQAREAIIHLDVLPGTEIIRQ